MRHISDALELLTAQHEEIDELLAKVRETYDAATFDQLSDRIVAHLALEQELFYPVIAATITREVMGEVLLEHVSIKRVLAELVWLGVEDTSFGPLLADLGDLLDGHAGWQEQQLFQTVAESVSAETLVALGGQLVEHETAFPLAIAA
jgi:hypothetical protein